MPLIGAMMGASAGVVGQLLVNNLQKLPLYVRPWETAAMGALGGYLGHRLGHWRHAMQDTYGVKATALKSDVAQRGGDEPVHKAH